MQEAIQDAAVHVSNNNAKWPVWKVSGFRLGAGHVITVAHVVPAHDCEDKEQIEKMVNQARSQNTFTIIQVENCIGFLRKSNLSLLANDLML